MILICTRMAGGFQIFCAEASDIFTRWCIALVVLVLCEGEVQGKPSGKSCVRSGWGVREMSK